MLLRQRHKPCGPMRINDMPLVQGYEFDNNHCEKLLPKKFLRVM